MFRDLRDIDRPALEAMLRATSSFRGADVDIALELIDHRLERGDSSEYRFVVADEGGNVLGYACFGHVPLTDDSFDLYWLVVAPDRRGQGIGARLVARVKEETARLGCSRLYAETSSGGNYRGARSFYQAAGFIESARLPGFYRKGEDKVIYCFERKNRVENRHAR